MRISNSGAVLLCVAGMTIVGGSVSISQLLLDYPILTAQALRYALAAAALFAVDRWFSRSARRPVPSANRPVADRRAADRRAAPGWRGWLVLGLLAATGLAGFNVCVMIGIRHADPAAVGTIIGSAPIGLALLGPLLRGRRPSPRLVVAAVTVVLGTTLVQGAGRADPRGLLAALGALGGEIAFSLLAAAVLPRLGPVRVAGYSCALAVPLLGLGAVLAGEPARWRPPTPTETATIGYLAALMTVVAFLFWFTGLRRLGVERAGVITGVMPIATLVTAALQAGRLPEAQQTAGVLVVALGLAAGLAGAGRRSSDGDADGGTDGAADARRRRRQEAAGDESRSRARTVSA